MVMSTPDRAGPVPVSKKVLQPSQRKWDMSGKRHPHNMENKSHYESARPAIQCAPESTGKTDAPLGRSDQHCPASHPPCLWGDWRRLVEVAAKQNPELIALGR